ncbi:MAG: hypothetical protein RL434_177 [Pseudomonadota bacterium]
MPAGSHARALPGWAGFFCLLCLSSMVGAQPAGGNQSAVDVWTTFLKPRYFKDVVLVEDDTVITLKTPYRAEDAAFTPVSVTARFPQTPARFIEKIFLIIDNNPEPLAGRFTFTPEAGRADLALRVRVDSYTHVRAVAVLNTGEHHVVSNFVKAQGGCSAPLGSDYKAAIARMGEMNFRTLAKPASGDAILGQLLLRHPNVSGMQKDQKTQLIRPAHFIKTLRLSYNGKPIMTAETGISISEDPSFRFFFRPEAGGELRAEISDSEGLQWSRVFTVDGQGRASPVDDASDTETRKSNG